VVPSARRAETIPETGRAGHGWLACSTGQVGPAVTVPCTVPDDSGIDFTVVAADPHPAERAANATARTTEAASLIAF
jgi:hypothetical protein